MSILISQNVIFLFLGINSFCSGRIYSANRSQRQKSSRSTLSMGCCRARKWWTLRLFEITNNAHVSASNQGSTERQISPELIWNNYNSDHTCKIFKKSLTIYITKIIELLVSQMVPIPMVQVIYRGFLL